MGRNEAATMRELEAHQAVILPLIAKQGGSIVDIAGDDIVAQFPSAVRAVECAVAMQKAMAERNSGVPAGRRMLLRIGVDLGDIIHDTNRTYGDGINVAARLEPLRSRAASAFRPTCATRSSASSAWLCATLERSRSRTLSGRSTFSVLCRGCGRLALAPRQSGHPLMADKAANSIRLLLPLRQARLAQAFDDALFCALKVGSSLI